MSINTDKIEINNNNCNNIENNYNSTTSENKNEPTTQTTAEGVNKAKESSGSDSKEASKASEEIKTPLETVYNKPGTRLNLDELLGKNSTTSGLFTPSKFYTKQQDKVEFLCIKRKRDTDAVPLLVVDSNGNSNKRGREEKKGKTYELQCTTEEGESFLKGLPDTVKSTISDLVSGKATASSVRPPPKDDEIPKPVTGKRPRFKVISKETLPFESTSDSVIYNVEYDFDYDKTTFKGPSHKKQMSTQISEDLELMKEFQKLELAQIDYVYDIYKVNPKPELNPINLPPQQDFGLLNMNQFGDSDIDIQDDSDIASDEYDSNDENHFANDYPDEEFDLEDNSEEDYNYEAYDPYYEDQDETPGNHFDFVKPKGSRVRDMYNDELYHDVETTEKFSNFEDFVMDYDDGDEYSDYAEEEGMTSFFGGGTVSNDYGNSARGGGSGYGFDYDD